MTGSRSTRIAVAISVAALGCAAQHAHDHDHAHTHLPRREVPPGAGAPLFNDLGTYHRAITTRSELAQRYFDQGLILGYEAARKLSANMTPEIVAEVPIAEEFAPMELFALVRFGRWEALLAAPPPQASWRYATGVWHFGRGMAHAARGETSQTRAELDRLGAIAREPEQGAMVFASGSTPAQLLIIGTKVLGARIATVAGEHAQAIDLLREAVALQDALPYTEPPPWYFPTREALGQALLDAGRPAEAEAVFREQLEYTPRNGWSLYGLAESLGAQGKHEAAEETRDQLAEVWQRADVTLTGAVL
jgi:tetratricopeptide (TPR) repeat protein